MPTRIEARRLAMALVLVLMAAACGSVATSPTISPTTSPGDSPRAASPTPSPASSPAPSGSGPVDSEAEAAARVLRSDPRFAGIGPVRPDLIGQADWYEASDSGGGYGVTVTMGWGDCQAGCISRHRWLFHVDPDGEVVLVFEDGDELPADHPPPPEVTGDGTLDIVLLAGPTCAVETEPPAPECEPAMVADATVVVSDPDGNEVARVVSDAEGHAMVADLPAGVYVVEALPVQGYMGTPAAVAVWALESEPGTAVLAYDTGIR